MASPMWTLQALTGLRPGEVYALEEGDLDLDRTLRVARTLATGDDRHCSTTRTHRRAAVHGLWTLG